MADLDLEVDHLVDELEDIVLTEALGYKKPEKAGKHSRRLAASAVEKILERLCEDALAVVDEASAASPHALPRTHC